MTEGLTEEYIEEQVQKSKYAEEVRRSIRRFYEGLNEPAAPVVGLARDAKISSLPGKEEVVEKLAQRGIQAVCAEDPKAADPNLFVVSDNLELHSPFLPPEDALKANIAMIEVITEYGGKACCSNPHMRESFVEAKDAEKHEDVSDLSKLHPEKAKEALKDFYQGFSEDSKDSFTNFQILLKSMEEEKKQHVLKDFKEQMALLGGVNACTFEQRNTVASSVMRVHEDEILQDAGTFKIYQKQMLHEAWEKGISPDVVGKDNAEALARGEPPIHVFHGGQQGTKAYANLGQSANINFQFGAVGVQFECDSQGSLGYAFGQSSHNIRLYTEENKALRNGFLYQYESRGEKQEMLFIENAGKYDGGKFNLQDCKGAGDETVILPHQNKLEKMYLAVRDVNPQTGVIESRLFELEMDDKGQIKDKRWRDFAELHDPVNDNLKGYMIDRCNNMIKDYDEHGKEVIMLRKLDIKTAEPETKSVQTAEETKPSKTAEAILSGDDRLAALSGRPIPSFKAAEEIKAPEIVPVVAQQEEKIGLKVFFRKTMDRFSKSLKEKFEKPKEKTEIEKAQDKKSYQIIQTLRGICHPRKSSGRADDKLVQTNENIIESNETQSAVLMMQQRDNGR